MLPYPNPHQFCISQEPPQPNPSGFPTAPAHLDQHYEQFFFPGHGQYFNSETLEAMLRPSRVAPAAATAMTSTAAAPAEPRNGARARKRPFRTDRHSKIQTAQGVRDRRMRLSLDVARDFFALQDQLGFDKASKTVDWLLTQSKPAIDRLFESCRLNVGGGDAGMPSPTSAERGERWLKEASAAAAGSEEEGDAEKARGRGGGSVLIDQHGCELNGDLMPAPMLGEYYYDLGEMMGNNEGEGDDEEEDGDFLDGMQY